jgi:hypothetical protein
MVLSALLDLLAERVGVLHEQGGRHSSGEVEGVRDVEQDLASQTGLARRAERGEGTIARCRVDDHLARRGCFGKRCDAHSWVGLGPRVEWRIAHGIRLEAGQGRGQVASSHGHLMPQPVKALGDSSANHARAQDRDPHRPNFPAGLTRLTR